MRIAPSLSVLCAVVLSACSMDSTSPRMPSISPNAANLDRSSQSVGQVFTISNAAAGNSVLVFARGVDGSLHAAGTYATGGAGTGAGLNSQGALALDESRSTLVVVNAGSNDISAFRVGDERIVGAHRQDRFGRQHANQRDDLERSCVRRERWRRGQHRRLPSRSG